MRMNPFMRTAEATPGHGLGNPTPDFFTSSEGGRNVCVLGDTRSGMSALFDQVESSLAAHGGAVHRFDTGRSLGQLASPCQDAEGQARLAPTSGDRP